MLEEDIYELNGYVRDPVGTLKNLLISIQSEIDYDRLELARQHHWAEIMAVMWRDVAQKGSLDAHGSIKRVISAVGAYYESRQETNTPSEGQLRDAVFWMKEQLISPPQKNSYTKFLRDQSEAKAKRASSLKDALRHTLTWEGPFWKRLNGSPNANAHTCGAEPQWNYPDQLRVAPCLVSAPPDAVNGLSHAPWGNPWSRNLRT